MLHDDVVREIQERAAKLGVLSHYCGKALHCKGDRGVPDLLLVGPHKAAFIEVKTQYANLAPDQTTWMHALIGAGQLHYVMREADLENGRLASVLETLAYGQPVLFGGAVA